MASIFEKWNKNVDAEALVHDVEEAAENGGGEYKEVPTGDYEVRIDKMELKESKKGNPMFSCWFKILNGEYENSLIFMNQVITQGFQIHQVNEFLRSLESGVEIKFDGNYEHYNNMILDVAEAIDETYEYGLEYGENKKGYPTFKIVDVFELD